MYIFTHELIQESYEFEEVLDMDCFVKGTRPDLDDGEETVLGFDKMKKYIFR